MNTITETPHHLISQLAESINAGIADWETAGRIIVQLLDDHHYTLQSIAEQSDTLNEDLLARFEQIGRKQLSPQLLTATWPARNFMLSLPYSEQQRILNGSVDLLTDQGDTLKVAPKNLTRFQCRQVFSRGSVRDMSAQRAWIESERMDVKLPEKINGTYSVKGKKVVITGPCSLDQADLLRMLQEIQH